MQDTTWNKRNFPMTRWTLICDIQSTNIELRREAFAALYKLYWKPLYAFLRFKGNSPATSEDLVQGLFEHLYQKDNLSSTNPQNGKLRAYLLASMKNYMAHIHRHNSAQKRGGNYHHLSLDVEDAEHTMQIQDNTELTADRIYDRNWTLVFLDNVIAKLRTEYADRGCAEEFDAYRSHIDLSSTPVSHQEIAQQLNRQPNTIKVAIHRLKKRYQQLVRGEMADCIGEDDNIDEELGYLRGLFGW